MRGHINVLWPTYGFVANEQNRRNYYFRRRDTESGSHPNLCLHDLVEFEVDNGDGVTEAVNVRWTNPAGHATSRPPPREISKDPFASIGS
jgi:hypothetical protein